jgi:hypothetical protein
MSVEKLDVDLASARLPLDDLNTKARRNLKLEDLVKLYSEDEISFLLGDYSYPQSEIPETPYDDQFNRQEEEAARQRLIRKWTPVEDEFLIGTYMYLSDYTIALALNMPINIVRSRRKVLKLFKQQTTNLEVIIWAKREDFEKDLREQYLTKARPEAFTAYKE